MNIKYAEWAQLAINYDDADFLPMPILCQPKLNGVRAKWDFAEQKLISRQGEVFPVIALPHLYEQLMDQKHEEYIHALDGELYCHNLSFQEICARVAVGRTERHPNAYAINFYTFAAIGDKPHDNELPEVGHVNGYPNIILVPTTKIYFHGQIQVELDSAVAQGFEGIMLRYPGVIYRPGRTEALIKLKPWKYGVGQVIGMKEGLGKFKGMLGSFLVQHEVDGKKIHFRVGGGLMDDNYRTYAFKLDVRPRIKFRYREESDAGKPLQPQFVKEL